MDRRRMSAGQNETEIPLASVQPSKARVSLLSQTRKHVFTLRLEMTLHDSPTFEGHWRLFQSFRSAQV